MMFSLLKEEVPFSEGDSVKLDMPGFDALDKFLPEMTMQKITPIKYLNDAKNNQYSKCQNIIC